MFKIASDLTQVLRKEFAVAQTGNGQVLVSGVNGTWVTLDSSQNAIMTSAATGLAWPIWNESYRDGTVGGWPGDVTNAKRVSVIVGKIFATTDQFTNSPSISKGDPLTTAAGGVLTKATIGTDPIVAYCVKPSYNYGTYLGKAYSAVIDIVTV